MPASGWPSRVEQRPHAIELELPLVVRRDERPLVIDTSDQPIDRRLAGMRVALNARYGGLGL